MAKRKGRDFELLVEALERLCQADDAFSISSPAYLIDRENGQRREIDVLLVHQVGNRKTSVAFECKDLNRPVDSPIIEAFSGKCDALDVDIRVIVSANRYASSCIAKARAKDVMLHTVEQSIDFNWSRVAGVLEDEIIFKALEVTDTSGQLVKLEELTVANGQHYSLRMLLDQLSVRLLAHIGSFTVTCDGDLKDNSIDLILLGLSRPFPRIDGGPVGEVLVRVKFAARRVFSSFGYFAYKRTCDERRFGKTTSKIGVDDNITTLLYPEDVQDRLLAIGDDSGLEGEVRGFRRLVSWDQLGERLLECGPRHHLQLAQHSDTLTLSGFIAHFDEGASSNGEWEGVDQFPLLVEDSSSSVSAYSAFQKRKNSRT